MLWIGIVYADPDPDFHFDDDPRPDPDWHQNDHMRILPQVLHRLNTDPDRNALDAGRDPDPVKRCHSDPIQIRIQIHNTVKLNSTFSRKFLET